MGWPDACRKGRGLVPAGLGARDTLRFEAALPLYGRDFEDISPLEAGLEKFVLGKEDFIGKDVVAATNQGVKRKLTGLKCWTGSSQKPL